MIGWGMDTGPNLDSESQSCGSGGALVGGLWDYGDAEADTKLFLPMLLPKSIGCLVAFSAILMEVWPVKLQLPSPAA